MMKLKRVTGSSVGNHAVNFELHTPSGKRVGEIIGPKKSGRLNWEFAVTLGDECTVKGSDIHSLHLAHVMANQAFAQLVAIN